MTTAFGRRLKAARKHAKLTQKQLAPMVNMSQSNMSDLENTAHGSSFTVQLAAACRVNAHWLATGEGQMLDPLNTALSAREAEPTPSLDLVLEALGMALARVHVDQRAELGDALRQWATYGGRDTYRRTVAELLKASAAPQQTGRR